MRQDAASWTHPVPIVFVSRADHQQSQDFFDAHWPQANFVTDIEGRLAQEFQVRRGRFWQMFGWRTWLQGLRAWLKGHRISWPTRDPWQMSGYFLVEGGQIQWSYHPVYAGDLPTLSPPPWSTS